MLVSLVAPKASKIKVDPFASFVKDGEWNILNIQEPGGTSVPVRLDNKYRPESAEDAARLARWWSINQTSFLKTGKDQLRMYWSGCSRFTFNRITKVSGNKGYGCKVPTTLANVVNSPKRADWFEV